MAWFKRNPGKATGLIFHSDRGSQYASEDFSEVLKLIFYSWGASSVRKLLISLKAELDFCKM
jgi:transposase InsO family protein